MLAELQKSQTEDASLKLEDAAQRDLIGVKYELEITSGDPGESIVAAEKRCAADLVVMATHGRHGVSRLMLGSVAERVVRSAAVPVLTVRRPN
jgi:nucleotide-binding universal stress UspA family protein